LQYNLFDLVNVVIFQVRIHSFLEKTKNYQRKKIEADTEEGLRKEKEILRKRVNSLIRTRRLKEVQKLLKNEEFEPWGRDTQAKVCGYLIFCFQLANRSSFSRFGN
jgi:DNA-directed RNA polymerase